MVMQSVQDMCIGIDLSNKSHELNKTYSILIRINQIQVLKFDNFRFRSLEVSNILITLTPSVEIYKLSINEM